MASRDRERRLERERHERQQQRRIEAAAQGRRRNQIIAALVAVVLVIGGLVAIGIANNGDETDDVVADPGSAVTAPPSAEPSSAPTAAACPAPGPEPVASPTSFAAPEDQGLDAATYTAVIDTNCGPVTVTLDAENAPETVNSFAFLARSGFFDNTPCHRLTTEGIFVLQCGDPTGAGTGGPGYSIPLENAPEDGVYPAGTLAMARSTEPDSGGSQFFIVYQDSQLPAPGYSIFGQIDQGLDVVSNVAAAGVAGGATDGAPAQSIGLTSVTIDEG